uniref:P-type domain-containing protein n=1 Tax=Ascaris lumbricoides TaxID=6252 RepID=A0A9J2PS95_ASCLU
MRCTQIFYLERSESAAGPSYTMEHVGGISSSPEFEPYIEATSVTSVSGWLHPAKIQASEPGGDPRKRVDCFPEPVENVTELQRICVTRGCIFDAEAHQSISSAPQCYFPRNTGYALLDQNESDTTMIYKKGAFRNPYGADIAFLHFSYSYNGATLCIHIGQSGSCKTAANCVWMGERSARTASAPVSRARTEKGVSAFLFADQYIQIATLLPTDRIYGFGEHAHSSLKHDLSQYTTWGMFARSEAPDYLEKPLKNLHGVHPFYMGLEHDSMAHGVFISNSNAQEITTGPGPHLVYRTIGGNLDIHFFPGPKPEHVVQQYQAFIGSPLLPSYYSLGFQIGRNGYARADELETVVNKLSSTGILFDVVNINMDYMNGSRDFTLAEGWTVLENVSQNLHKDGYRITLLFNAAISVTGASFRRALLKVSYPFCIFERVPRNSKTCIAFTGYFSRNFVGDCVVMSTTNIVVECKLRGMANRGTRSKGSQFALCGDESNKAGDWVQTLLPTIQCKEETSGTEEWAQSSLPYELNKVMLGVGWPNEHVAFPDFLDTTSQTNDWWSDELLLFNSSVHFDGIWLDMNEPSSFRTNEQQSSYNDGTVSGEMTPLSCPLSGAFSTYDNPSFKTANAYYYGNKGELSSKTLCMIATTGGGSMTFYNTKNLYGLQQSIATFKALKGTTRQILIARSTFPSSGRYAGHCFAADSTGWAGLRGSIIAAQEFNLFGIPYVGSYICGDNSTLDDVELCVRWYQLGAFYSLSRSTFPSSGRYAGHCFAADSTGWAGLRGSIIAAQEFNLFGIPYVGSYICGDNSTLDDVELCVRWYQLGAFYSLSSDNVYKDSPSKDPIYNQAVAIAAKQASIFKYRYRPYLYSDNIYKDSPSKDPLYNQAIAIAAKQASIFKYRYRPYLYSLHFDVALNGGTVLRPVFFEFPDDSNTVDIDEQFMWGEAIMVIPVVQQKTVSVSAYLPNARWYSLRDEDYGAEVAAGERVLNAPNNESIPVLIRGIVDNCELGISRGYQFIAPSPQSFIALAVCRTCLNSSPAQLNFASTTPSIHFRCFFLGGRSVPRQVPKLSATTWSTDPFDLLIALEIFGSELEPDFATFKLNDQATAIDLSKSYWDRSRNLTHIEGVVLVDLQHSLHDVFTWEQKSASSTTTATTISEEATTASSTDPPTPAPSLGSSTYLTSTSSFTSTSQEPASSTSSLPPTQSSSIASSEMTQPSPLPTTQPSTSTQHTSADTTPATTAPPTTSPSTTLSSLSTQEPSTETSSPSTAPPITSPSTTLSSPSTQEPSTETSSPSTVPSITSPSTTLSSPSTQEPSTETSSPSTAPPITSPSTTLSSLSTQEPSTQTSSGYKSTVVPHTTFDTPETTSNSESTAIKISTEPSPPPTTSITTDEQISTGTTSLVETTSTTNAAISPLPTLTFAVFINMAALFRDAF